MMCILDATGIKLKNNDDIFGKCAIWIGSLVTSNLMKSCVCLKIPNEKVFERIENELIWFPVSSMLLPI